MMLKLWRRSVVLGLLLVYPNIYMGGPLTADYWIAEHFTVKKSNQIRGLLHVVVSVIVCRGAAFKGVRMNRGKVGIWMGDGGSAAHSQCMDQFTLVEMW